MFGRAEPIEDQLNTFAETAQGILLLPCVPNGVAKSFALQSYCSRSPLEEFMTIRLSSTALRAASTALICIFFSTAAFAQVLSGDPLWTRPISGGFGPTQTMGLAVNNGPGTIVVGNAVFETPDTS